MGRFRVLSFHGDSALGGRLDSRRSGEARSVDVGEIKRVLHHLGVLECLVFDAIDGVKVDFFLSR